MLQVLVLAGYDDPFGAEVPKLQANVALDRRRSRRGRQTPPSASVLTIIVRKW
jgi:hypothetical protein